MNFGRLFILMAGMRYIPQKIRYLTWKNLTVTLWRNFPSTSVSPCYGQAIQSGEHIHICLLKLPVWLLQVRWHLPLSYSLSLVTKQGTPAAQLPPVKKKKRGQMTATVSVPCQITHSFQLSSECHGLGCRCRRFATQVGEARRHSLSSEGQKGKYDHLRCNSCLCLLGLSLTVLGFHWACNWTYDTRTCRVIGLVIYFPVTA